MAQYKGYVVGGRGSVSRLGHKSSGLNAVCNGWESWVEVVARYSDVFGDIFDIYKTGGSNGGSSRELIGSVNKGKFYPAKDYKFVDVLNEKGGN